jgi:hypothetical protein
MIILICSKTRFANGRMVSSSNISSNAEDEHSELTVLHKAPSEKFSVERGAADREQPWWTGLVLCCAILAVSSAAAAFKYIEGAAAVTRAGWRLQVHTVCFSLQV